MMTQRLDDSPTEEEARLDAEAAQADHEAAMALGRYCDAGTCEDCDHARLPVEDVPVRTDPTAAACMAAMRRHVAQTRRS